MPAPRISSIPCLTDNYAYLVICPETGQAAVVDPSEAAPVEAALERAGAEVRLVAIWNTHHHHDHVGGNQALLARRPDLQVIGHSSDRDRIPGQTTFVDAGAEVRLGGLTATIIHNPGHTRGAISYVVDGRAVFTGDTLFGAGCGRLFEGTPADMFTSLAKLTALAPETEVYCGHEYTEKNLGFAAEAEPDNPAIAERRRQVAARRARGEASVPFSIADERSTNPFARASSVERLAELRAWKDRY